MAKIKYRCTFWKDSGCKQKSRILSDWKAKECAEKGCRRLRSFTVKEHKKELNYG